MPRDSVKNAWPRASITAAEVIFEKSGANRNRSDWPRPPVKPT